jgi:hypothetical protein
MPDKISYELQKNSILSNQSDLEQIIDNIYEESHGRVLAVPNVKQEKKKFKDFLGSRIFVDKNNTRTSLPYLAEPRSIPIWKIIKQFIGQDLTQVSMPVILNEPLSAI